MSVTASASKSADLDLGERLCVISSDAHVGPTMEQLRPYCPQKLLPELTPSSTGPPKWAGLPRPATCKVEITASRCLPT